MSAADELRARGVPDEWVEFFARLRTRAHTVMETEALVAPEDEEPPRLTITTDDLLTLLGQAEEGVIAGARADAAIHRALASAAKSEERVKEFMRKEAGLQQQVDDARVETMERACAAVCERCAAYGPAVMSHESEQWWHYDTPGDIPGDGWCSAQQIRRALQRLGNACAKQPGTECACDECQAAARRLQQQGPHGPGSCRECGGYNLRWDLGPDWRVDCVDCGNGGDLPRQIPAPDPEPAA